MAVDFVGGDKTGFYLVQHDADHPVDLAFPEGNYLKRLLLQAD